MVKRKKQQKPECFVIAPIGEAKSPTRERTEKVKEFIIGPAADECGYEVKIAHKMHTAGLISTDIVSSIVEAPLVIADLTEGNANVFYELSLRHVIAKPVVQIVQKSHPVPFDVHNVRTIMYGLDVEEAAEAKDELVEVIKGLNRQAPTNPILQANKLAVYFIEGAAGPSDLQDMIDSIFLAHRIRYRVIENFADDKYGGSDEARINHLRENVQAVLRESDSRGFTQSSRMFQSFGKYRTIAEQTFVGAADILPRLHDAMARGNIDDITEQLGRWRRNNDLYILAVTKRLEDLVHDHSDVGANAEFEELLAGETKPSGLPMETA